MALDSKPGSDPTFFVLTLPSICSETLVSILQVAPKVPEATVRHNRLGKSCSVIGVSPEDLNAVPLQMYEVLVQTYVMLTQGEAMVCGISR